MTMNKTVKVKVKLSLCYFFNQAPRHERAVGEWMYSSTHSLTSALDGEWSALRPGRFTLRERAPGTHWIGGWVGLRAVLDAVVKRKIRSPSRESNPKIPIVQTVAQRYHGSLSLSHTHTHTHTHDYVFGRWCDLSVSTPMFPSLYFYVNV
jgi:hypothetical protein